MTSTIKVNNIQNQCGANIINENSNTITIGASGDTVALASGASQTGFGRSGSVNWQTTPKTGNFTAADGEGYFINSSSPITMSLPAGSAGAIVAVSDYARNFATHNLTVSPNGSELIGGFASDAILNVNGQAATFVYVDGTKGWINVQNAEDTETGVPPFLQATGGTVTTSGNDKIHTFTGPGSFIVCSVASTPANNQVSYLVVAGGGGGGAVNYQAGGGGAGGFREDKSPVTPYTASPLEGAGAITVTATSFPITVGAGGPRGSCSSKGVNGSDSIFSTITAAGGGGGGNRAPSSEGPGNPGGSGGGGGRRSDGADAPGGTGNTPSVSPSQGSNGGSSPGPMNSGPNNYQAGAGGGATAVGESGPQPNYVSDGGAGATTSISGTPTAYAGGGGSGGAPSAVNPTGGAGGTGGGGTGAVCSVTPTTGANGTANTGGGGGGGAGAPIANAGDGGSGIVIIRYKFQ
jgi:hypothetical protein